MKVFSANGRIRRSAYFVRSLLLLLPGAVLEVMAESSQSDGLMAIAALLLIIGGILQIIQGIKRLHDLNQNGWLMLLFLIPVVNFGLGIYMLLWDGTIGPNNYRSDPKGRA